MLNAASLAPIGGCLLGFHRPRISIEEPFLLLRSMSEQDLFYRISRVVRDLDLCTVVAVGSWV